eukprot:4439117-Pyramimonas_sp.AAC.1
MEGCRERGTRAASLAKVGRARCLFFRGACGPRIERVLRLAVAAGTGGKLPGRPAEDDGCRRAAR